MKPRSALVNSMAYTDPDTPARVSAAELDRTIADKSEPMPLDGPLQPGEACTELGADTAPARLPLDPLFDRYPRGSVVVVLLMLLLTLGLAGMGEPEHETVAEAAAQELADEYALAAQAVELAALAASEGTP